MYRFVSAERVSDKFTAFCNVEREEILVEDIFALIGYKALSENVTATLPPNRFNFEFNFP